MNDDLIARARSGHDEKGEGMTNQTAKEIRDNFLLRDELAVEDHNNLMPSIENKLHFESGRVRDLATICLFLLEREIAREKLVEPLSTE